MVLIAGARSRRTGAAPYSVVLVETRGAVGLITLNRPKALNALNSQLIAEINAAARDFDANPAIGAIVLTGSDRAFAAGADIKEMATVAYPDVYTRNMFAEWADLTKITKPVRFCSLLPSLAHMISRSCHSVAVYRSFRCAWPRAYPAFLYRRSPQLTDSLWVVGASLQ